MFNIPRPHAGKLPMNSHTAVYSYMNFMWGWEEAVSRPSLLVYEAALKPRTSLGQGSLISPNVCKTLPVTSKSKTKIQFLCDPNTDYQVILVDRHSTSSIEQMLSRSGM